MIKFIKKIVWVVLPILLFSLSIAAGISIYMHGKQQETMDSEVVSDMAQ